MTKRANARTPAKSGPADVVQIVRETVELLGRGLEIMRGETKNDTAIQG